MAPRLTTNQELGEYRIAGFLGAGGMGEVYRATHRTLGRDVAIKVSDGAAIGIDRTPQGLDGRFENEARIQASLAHPHIAAMHEYFERGGLRCLVMEFVPGETLAARLRRARALEPADALAVLESVTDAAAFMHARGIVHRDLTPSNIRITPDGTVKVLDFGIAKLEHRKGLTAEGQVIGTPAYLSPEQLRTGRATFQSDVWALGVLLFEMIAGHPPFRGRFPNEVWHAIESSRVPDLREIMPDGDPLCGRVEAILHRCLAVDPEARFKNAGELLAALGDRPRGTHLTRRHRTHVTPTYPRIHHTAWWAATAMVILTIAVAALWREPAPATTTVHRIDVTEGAADVLINGRRRGRTPFDYEATRREVVALELRQPGFLTLREQFDITERPVWTLAMRRRP